MATQSDSPNTAVIATIVIVGTFSMISISALLTTLVRSREAEVDEIRPQHADLEAIAALDHEQAAVLNAAPHWVDQKAGKLGISIERAKQLVLADLRKDPTAASPPIPPGLVLPPQPPPAPPPDGALGTPAAPAEPALAPAGAAAPAAVVPAPSGAAPAPAAPTPAAPHAASAAPSPAAPSPAAPSPAAPGSAAPHAPGTP